MADKKIEQMLEHLVNDDVTKAEELFHEYVVAKSREIYESLIDSEIEEAAEEDEEEEDLDEAAAEDESDEDERNEVGPIAPAGEKRTEETEKRKDERQGQHDESRRVQRAGFRPTGESVSTVEVPIPQTSEHLRCGRGLRNGFHCLGQLEDR